MLLKNNCWISFTICLLLTAILGIGCYIKLKYYNAGLIQQILFLNPTLEEAPRTNQRFKPVLQQVSTSSSTILKQYKRVQFISKDLVYIASDRAGLPPSGGLSPAEGPPPSLPRESPPLSPVNPVESESEQEAALFEPIINEYNLNQWHLFQPMVGINIDFPWGQGIRGGEIIVAVLDSGYFPHVDLLDNLLVDGGYDFISDPQMAGDGDGRDADPRDIALSQYESCDHASSGHGTHVMGIIAAATKKQEGMVGIAPGAKILPVRVIGCKGRGSDIADAIIWSAGGSVPGVPENKYPAKIINISVNGTAADCPEYYQLAIDTATELGATIVVSAGNNSSDAGQYRFANCRNVVVVSATNANGDRRYTANFGSVVDIAAPGEEIYSTEYPVDYPVIRSATSTSDHTEEEQDMFYGYRSGTSMAAPVVSGVLALLYELKPDLNCHLASDILRQTAAPFIGDCYQCGAGLVNAEAAVQQVLAMVERENRLPPKPFDVDSPLHPRNDYLPIRQLQHPPLMLAEGHHPPHRAGPRPPPRPRSSSAPSAFLPRVVDLYNDHYNRVEFVDETMETSGNTEFENEFQQRLVSVKTTPGLGERQPLERSIHQPKPFKRAKLKPQKVSFLLPSRDISSVVNPSTMITELTHQQQVKLDDTLLWILLTGIVLLTTTIGILYLKYRD